MSKEQIHSTDDRFVFLSSEEIERSATLNVRPYSTANETDKEQDEIRELMDSINQQGQIEPVIVRPNGGDKYVVTAGHRRIKAIEQLNLLRDADGSEPILVKAIVREGGDAYRDAIHENLKRKNFTPMDLALNIQTIRKMNTWNGAAGTKRVSEYLGVSAATVVQHEKLLKLDKEVQIGVQSGVLTVDAALALEKGLKELPEEQRKQAAEDVLDEAKRIEQQRQQTAGETEAEVEVNAGVSGKKKKKKAAKKAANGRKVRQAKGGKSAVSARSVKKAVRNVVGTKLARNKADLLDWIEGENGPAYGGEDGVARVYLAKLAGWMAGGVSDRALSTAFKALADHAPKTEVKVTRKEPATKVAAGAATATAPKKARPKK